MRFTVATAILAATLVLAGCQKEENATMPSPYALTADAMGRYCGMNVLEHSGPKGQIILQDIPEPIWFSSARDTVAFTMLPEEPKDVAAIYVSDMGAAPSWGEPGAQNWIDATKAFYVIGSKIRGGMGAEEAVPFSSERAARDFAERNGGRVTGFEQIPKDYVLGTGASEYGAGIETESHGEAQTHG